MLELLVSPHLSKDDKKEIKDWDDKVDVALALAVFFPDTAKSFNEQVKSLTGGKLDIYEADKMMHKLLGK